VQPPPSPPGRCLDRGRRRRPGHARPQQPLHRTGADRLGRAAQKGLHARPFADEMLICPRHASGARVGQTRRSQVALNGSEDAHRLGRNPCKIGASASFVALATLLWSGLSRITPPGERSAARTAGSTASAAAVTAQFHAAMRSRPPLFGSGVRRDDPPDTVIPVDGRLQATRTAATPWKGWWPILGRHALARLFRHVE